MNEDIGSQLVEAELLLQSGRHDDALKLLLRVRAGLGGNAEPTYIAGCELLLGTALSIVSRPADAIEAFEKARGAFARLGMEHYVASCEGNIANALRALSRWQEAIDRYSSALAEFERLGVRSDVALAAMNVGVSFRDLGQPLKAIEYFEKALIVLREPGNENNLAICTENLGTAMRDLGRHAEAIAFLREAKTLYGRLGMDKDAADCDDGIGIALNEMGRPADALKWFGSALPVYLRLNFPRNAADCAVNKGNALRALSRYQDALVEFNRSVPVFEALGLERQVADCETNIGNVYMELGQPENALPLFIRSRELYERFENPKLVALAENNVSCSLNAMGRYEEALARCNSARSTYSGLGMGKDVAGCDINLGKTLIILGRVEEAFAALESARITYRQLSLRSELANCELMTGNALLDCGDARAACTRYSEARRLYRSLMAPRHTADCDANMGVAYLVLEQYESAREHLVSALSVFTELALPKDIEECRINLSLCLSAEGCFAEALAYVESALENPGAQPVARETADRFLAAGIAHRGLKQPAMAIAFQERAKMIYTSLGLERRAATCENNISIAFFDAGHVEEALRRSKAAMDVLEVLRGNIASMQFRAGFGEMNCGPWEVATLASLHLGRIGEGLVILERSRARTLAEGIGMSLECDPGEIDPQIYREYCDARRSLTESGLAFPSTPEKARGSQRAFRAILDDILDRYPNTAFARGLRGSAVTYLEHEEDYLALLPDSRSCLLDFLAWPDMNGSLRAFLITRKNGLEMVEFGDGSLAKLIAAGESWKQIYDLRRTTLSSAQLVSDICFQLDELIFSAQVRIVNKAGGTVKRCRFLDYLDETLGHDSPAGSRSICIVPHRLLFLLPLHAAARRDNKRVRYLLEDYVISYAPSAYLLHHAKRRVRQSQQTPRALVVGNPMPSPRPLPGAAVEAGHVAGQLRSAGWEVDELSDIAATRSSFLHGNGKAAGIYSGNYTHIHLAQHALVQPDGHAALVFAQPTGDAAEREFLCQDTEILRAELSHVEAVVAATCVSSVTDPGMNEYLGLGAAFLHAGARTFLGTLYPLSDLGSQRLIPEIYRGRFDQNLSWAQSLRAAQLKMLLPEIGAESPTDHDAAFAAQPGDGAAERGVSGRLTHAGDAPLPHHPYHWAAFAAMGAWD